MAIGTKWRWFILSLLILMIGCIVFLLIFRHNCRLSATENTILHRPQTSGYDNKKDTVNPLLPAIHPSDCIIRHNYFTLCYIESYEQPQWVAYKLTSTMLTRAIKRKDNFRADPMIRTGSATPADYTRSGYDKGHLCPATDMSFSADAMSETFYMSNMSPQTPQFNRGIWKTLEEKVREWALKNNELYITTGPVFKQVSVSIGKNKVAVPPYYYKVILDYNPPDLKGIGFIMLNQASNKNIADFAVSIDSVEKFTGIDFFTALPDVEENMIEKQCEFKNW